MADVADLFVRLRAETAPFTMGMRRATTEGESFTASMGGARAAMTKLGGATVLVGAAFLAYGVKAAGDFQQKMNLLVTACGESTKNLKMVSSGVLSLARQTGTSTDVLSEGMYQVEKAGYRAGDGLKVLRAAAQGAREEGADLKDVTNAMTSVMASYHLKATDSVRVMNALKTAAGEGKMTMQEFAGALSTVIPIASANKISFGEVGGAIATLSQHGTSAAEATQELASTIRGLAAPNNVAVQEMQRLGLSSIDVSTHLGKRGLTGTLDLLSQTVLSKMGPSGTLLLNAFNKTKQAARDADAMVKAMPPSLQKLATSYSKGSVSLSDWRKELKTLPPEQANLLTQYATLQNKTNGFSAELKRGGPSAQTYTEAIKKMTGGAIGLNTTLQLTGENTAGFKDRVDKVSASFNHASKNVEGWKTTQASFNVQMSRLKEAIVTVAIALGLKLIPVILATVTFFEKHKDVAAALAAVIGTLLVAAVYAFTVSLWNMAAALWATGVPEIVIGIALLIAGLVMLAMHWRQVWGFIKTIGLAVAHAVVAAWHWVADGTASIWHSITDWVVGAWRSVASFFSSAWHMVADPIVGAWHWVERTTAAVWNGITGFFRKWWPLLLLIFALPIGILVATWNHFHTQITNVAKAAWNGIKSLLQTTWNGIKAVAGALWYGIQIAIINPVMAIWHQIQSVWRTISGFLHANWMAIKSIASAAWSGIKQAMIDPIVAAWRSITTTVGNIKRSITSGLNAAWSAVKGIGSRFLQIGKAIIDGIIQGVRNGGSSLVSAMKGLAEGALNSAKKFLGIASPSKKFKELGGWVVHGLIDGLTGSTARVKSATTRLAKDLYVDFGSHHGGLQRYVARESKELMNLAHKRDDVATRLKAAQKKLADLKKAWSDEAKSVASGIMQGFSVVTDAPQEGFALTAADVVNKMRDQMAKAVQFAAQLQALKKKGLRTDLIEQIAAAGVDQGGATAAALSGASKSQINQINQLQTATKSAANAAGKSVADSMYGAGIKSAQGLVKGLQSQEKAIERQMMRIAKAMQKAIKKALGIRSPSQVFADLGGFIPQGLAKGIEGAAHHATTAASNLAGAVTTAGTPGNPGLALAGGGRGGGGTVVHNHLTIQVEGHVMTERNLRDVVEQSMLRLGMRNSGTYVPYKR
jgi:TP901 family phage tail tape measure protein